MRERGNRRRDHRQAFLKMVRDSRILQTSGPEVNELISRPNEFMSAYQCSCGWDDRGWLHGIQAERNNK